MSSDVASPDDAAPDARPLDAADAGAADGARARRARPDLTHRYATVVHWSGSTGDGYGSYDRGHDGSAPPAETRLALSSDPAFRGDPARLNPEQLVVLAASSCQLLSFLALAARARIDVTEYDDDATGEMPHRPGEPMAISRIVLRPRVTVRAPATDEAVRALLEQAHHECYIANSLRTEIVLEPTVVVVG